MHTIFEVALSQDRPLSEWVYDCLRVLPPQNHGAVGILLQHTVSLHLRVSPRFRMLPSGHVSTGVVTGCGGRVAHEGELEAQDVSSCCIAAIKQLRVRLHRVDMTTQYNKARANSPCSDDHKLGTLLDFLLIPENTSVGLKHIIDQVVAENVDALEMPLVKSKKLLKEASKAQTKLLTWLTKQKMTLEKTSLSNKICDQTSKVFSQTTAQLDQARTTVA